MILWSVWLVHFINLSHHSNQQCALFDSLIFPKSLYFLKSYCFVWMFQQEKHLIKDKHMQYDHFHEYSE